MSPYLIALIIAAFALACVIALSLAKASKEFDKAFEEFEE